ncbi:hypothetical protein AC578_7483 [Pseudocercospora eumusae]|uniref:Uncharacterized protein n=1 Tax=Pseudocercospora eumusae TaxID=321146 RepID=A0A139H1Q2_9PEZI|nr:hypothetical protein AC578_7483 [Pseudocercospora eumusae]
MAGNASTRVFGINELLEQILLELADALPSHVTATSGHTIPQPAYQLFVLQRTNVAFRDTIRHSKVMQRRMFLDLSGPISDARVKSDQRGRDLSQHENVSNWGPLLWMADWMKLHQGHWGMLEGQEIHYEVLRLRKMYRMHPVYSPKALKPEFQRSYAAAEASWRRIPVATTAKPRELMIKYVLTTGKGHVWRAFKPAPNATLGDVYDELVDTLGWSDEKCIKASNRRDSDEVSTADLFRGL